MKSLEQTRSAPIQSVYPTQVNYIVPDGTAPGIATVTTGTSSGAAQIDAIGPGHYSMSGTGHGVAAATAATYAADGTVTPQNVFQCNTTGTCTSAPMSLGNAGDQIAEFLDYDWRRPRIITICRPAASISRS